MRQFSTKILIIFRDDDLSYGRRTFEAHSLRPAFIPYHLYGQLASSKQGIETLIRHPDIHEILATLSNAADKNWPKIKAAIWSVANVCISHEGACFIDREGGIDALINIAENSQVLSLKATAFFALSLVATTRYGCHVLASKGWCTLKYARDDPWPVLEDWFLRFQLATLLDNDQDQDEILEDLKRKSSSSSLTNNTPILPSDESFELAPRSSSISSSRKRLSNLFKSFSDKRDNKSGSLTRKIRKSLFKNDDHENTETEVELVAPIATPERSKSSSGETLEEIKEEIEAKNNCTTESSTTSSIPQAAQIQSTSSR